MLDTPTAAPDITTADLQRWVDQFYRETAYAIINDSEDLPEDWKTQIRPQFRAFFFAQDVVKEKTNWYAFGDYEELNEQREQEIELFYQQSEKMLYAKVQQHLDFTEKGIIRLVFIVSGGIAGLLSSLSGRWNNLGSAYAGEDFLEHTDNIPWALPKDNKPAGYDVWDDTLFS